MKTTILSTSLALALSVAGCGTPAYLGGEFTHHEREKSPKAPMEELARRSKWVFFWGLLGTEKIDVPDVAPGMDIESEVAARFADDQRIIDLTVAEGNTIPGIICAFFTLGIVNEREIVVQGRKVPAARGAERTAPSSSGSP